MTTARAAALRTLDRTKPVVRIAVIGSDARRCSLSSHCALGQALPFLALYWILLGVRRGRFRFTGTICLVRHRTEATWSAKFAPKATNQESSAAGEPGRVGRIASKCPPGTLLTPVLDRVALAIRRARNVAAPSRRERPAAGDRLLELEKRIVHLEAMIEGLQDSVHREALRANKADRPTARAD